MNIPSKIAKSSYLSQEKIQLYQKTASKYYKQYNKIKQEYTKKKNLREEIFSWFFSLDLITKLIISSIENKWITCIMHQLYICQKYEPKLKFKIKELDFFNMAQQNENKEYVQSVLKVTINSDNSYIPNDYLNYNYYFSREDLTYNNFMMSSGEVDRNFLNEISFYRSEDLLLEIGENLCKYSNYFTLSEKILQDEALFKAYFSKLSQGKGFSSLIDTSYDTSNKLYNICLPEWIKSKDYYSISEIFAALFEQVITVKYILYKQNKNEMIRTQFETVYGESKELVQFINKKSIINNLFNNLNGELIIDQLFADLNIQEFVLSKFYNSERNFYLEKEGDFIFDKTKLNKDDIYANVELFFARFTSAKDSVDSIMFLSIDKLFSFDDFLYRKFYEALLNMRSQQNALDLMKELEEDFDYRDLEVSGTTDRCLVKVNKKKRKKKSSNSQNNNKTLIPAINSIYNNNDIVLDIKIIDLEQNINENLIINNANEESINKNDKQYAFSFIKRKSTNNYVLMPAETQKEESEIIYEEKEFLGNKMLIRTNSSLNKSKNEIDGIVKEIIDEILVKIENMLIIDAKKTSLSNNDRIDQNDIDTAYSSDGNKSDSTTQLMKNKTKKRKKENKFFLYNIKEKKQNQKSRVSLIENKPNFSINKIEDKIEFSLESNYQPTTEKTKMSPKLFQNEESELKEKVFSTQKSPFSNKIREINNIINKTNNINLNLDINVNFNMYTHPGTYCPRSMMPSPFSTFNPMMNFNPYSFNPYINNYSYEMFNMKIHKDILEYSDNVDQILNELKPIKLNTISYLDTEMRNFLKEKFQLKSQVELYGSFASDLGIESSDVDITLKIVDESRVDLVYIMTELVEYFKDKKHFETVNAIYTATVPVIKLVLDPVTVLDSSILSKLKKFKESSCYRKYPFASDDLDKIRVDITFQMDSGKTMQMNRSITQSHLDYIRGSISIFPEVKPMIQVLKRFLQTNNLHSSFNGGLASFSLFLLILAFTKIHRFSIGNSAVNLGKLFSEFLWFYGSLFDYSHSLVNAHLDNPFVMQMEDLDVIPTVLDPITYKNAAKSSYKIWDIRTMFLSYHDKLNEFKLLFEKKLTKNDMNIVYSLLRVEKQN